MNLYLFLSVLRARIGVFAFVLGVTVVAAVAVTLLLPKTYKATVSLVVDVKEEQSLSNVLHPLILPQERLSYMQTQTDIITSEKVARKVVQDLRLAENATARAAFAEEATSGGSIEDWLAANLLRRLKVGTSQSSVIQVSFSSVEPHFSALVANAFAKAYIDTMLELRVEPTREAAEWFDEQLKGLRANLEDAQAKLTDYYRRKGIVAADERYDVENIRLGELSSQVVRAQDQAIGWQTRERQARDFVERGGQLDELPEVLSDPLIQKLKSELVAGEAKLQELAAVYGANYPQYQRQLSENQSMRDKLDAQMRKIVTGLDSTTQQVREHEAKLRRAMAAQRARLLELKEDRNELTVLTRNMDSAQRAYDTAMQRFVVSQVDSRASQTNVTVLNPAVVPRNPSFPKFALNIALSVAVGTMLGVGIVILMEMIDRRVRSRDDLDHAWNNVPLLVELNEWRPGERRLLRSAGGSGRALPSPG